MRTIDFKRFLEIKDNPREEEGHIIIIWAEDDPYCGLSIRSKAEYDEFLRLLDTLARRLGWR